jgi:hypothetical protein
LHQFNYLEAFPQVIVLILSNRPTAETAGTVKECDMREIPLSADVLP